jgi:hypothetical protein
MRLIVFLIMSAVGIGIVVPDPGLGQDGGSSSGAPDSLTVTGVIERLDLAARKGLIKTATGKPVFFEIVKPELFKGMTIGQRVTLQLDEHGRAVKAIEMQSIPELPAPAQ